MTQRLLQGRRHLEAHKAQCLPAGNGAATAGGSRAKNSLQVETGNSGGKVRGAGLRKELLVWRQRCDAVEAQMSSQTKKAQAREPDHSPHPTVSRVESSGRTEDMRRCAPLGAQSCSHVSRHSTTSAGPTSCFMFERRARPAKGAAALQNAPSDATSAAAPLQWCGPLPPCDGFELMQLSTCLIAYALSRAVISYLHTVEEKTRLVDKRAGSTSRLAALMLRCLQYDYDARHLGRVDRSIRRGYKEECSSRGAIFGRRGSG